MECTSELQWPPVPAVWLQCLESNNPSGLPVGIRSGMPIEGLDNFYRYNDGILQARSLLQLAAISSASGASLSHNDNSGKAPIVDTKEQLRPLDTLPGLQDEKLVTDEFRMFSFKIETCPHLDELHDWHECPYLHPPGEKARRRDPRHFIYQSSPCPDFRKSRCSRGDSCPFAHGVFECWLHPSRYRTTLCKEGTACTRPVCFFAHTLEELREPTTNPANLSAVAAAGGGGSGGGNTTNTLSPPALPLLLPEQQQQQQQQQHQQQPIPTATMATTATACIGTTNNTTTARMTTKSPFAEYIIPASPASIMQHHRQYNNNHNNNNHNNYHHHPNLLSSAFSSSSDSSSLNMFSSRSTTPSILPPLQTSPPPLPSSLTLSESFRQASMSLPTSEDSSYSTSPLIDDNDLLMLASEGQDAASVAATAALRAQQQQQLQAAAAAQAALSRLLQSATLGVPPQPALPRTSSTASRTSSMLPFSSFTG